MRAHLQLRAEYEHLEHTNALAYVPSRPYRATGGLASWAGAACAYVLRAGGAMAQDVRDAAAREVTVINCLDSMLIDNRRGKEWQMLWDITDSWCRANRDSLEQLRQAFFASSQSYSYLTFQMWVHW